MNVLINGQQTQSQEVQQQGRTSGEHDFDFLIGSWTVEHQKLARRLARDNRWLHFTGTCTMRTLLGGKGNVDDNTLDDPEHPYRASSLRSYDPMSHQWSIWWLDDRHPGQLDPPVVGSFVDQVGTFYAHDTFEGRPILVRFIWSDITSTSAMWRQAFSEDKGETWETNWIMKFHRVR